jgi:hypothetical protein
MPRSINPIVGSNWKSIEILSNIIKSDKIGQDSEAGNHIGVRSVESDRIRQPRNMEFQYCV